MSTSVVFPSFTEKNPPKIGDLITLQIVLDEKINDNSGNWEIQGSSQTGWIASGALLLNGKSIQREAADGQITKWNVDAIVSASGPLRIDGFVMKNTSTEREVLVTASGSEAQVPAQEVKEEVAWTLPAVSFGGWSAPAIIGTALICLLILGFIARKIFRKLPEVLGGSSNPRDRAIHTLNDLQKYARSKRPLQQEDWKTFSFQLAGALRKYSDEYFVMDSSDMTDREFLTELRSQTSIANKLDSLESVLQTITEVRYGKKELDTSLVPGLLLDARKFIEDTYQPKEEEKKK